MDCTNPNVSIIVVAYRQRDLLVRCLRSCAEAAERVSGGAELIVVDNGDLAELVRASLPQTRVIEPHSNLGFAGAVSVALKEARGRWVALVNDDARIEPDALVRMVEAGEAVKDQEEGWQVGRGIGSVAGQVRFETDPGRINSAGLEVDSLGVATEWLAGRSVSEASRAREVFGPSGCFALYRTAMLAEVGGMDARFFAYLEDVDLAWRARAAGWRCVYEPGAIAYHHGSASSGEGSAKKYFLVGRNRVLLLARNATTGQLARALPGIALYDLAYVIYVALTDRTLAPLRGRIAGLRGWSTARRETRGSRRAVRLSSAWGSWRDSLRMQMAYRRLGGHSG